MERKKYVIIGGVAAGASAAARLRRLDENAQIIMIDKGDYVSYSNCSLPYRISEVVDNNDKLVLMNEDIFFKRYNIEVRVKNEAIKINEDKKNIVIKDIVQNKEYTESYDKLIITLGASAIVPNFKGLSNINYFVLKTVNNTAKLMNYIYKENPKSMVVIGGGFIGIEVAENLKERGIDVTLIEASNQLMQPLDFEMSLYVKKVLEDKDVKVILGDKVESFSKNIVHLESGNEINTDGVILSIGIKPETGFLKDTSIKLAQTGHIMVNRNYQTSNKDIYAGGDAILVENKILETKQPLPLAGAANKQGRLIADHICSRNINNKGYIGSSVIKVFDYTFASTGVNEKQLKNNNISDYEVAYVAATDKVSLMPNVNQIILKLLFEKETGKVLGAQGFSKGNVDKRIDVIATAIKFGATVYDLADLELVYAPHHGTGKDVVNKIGYQASNLVDGLFKQVTFEKVIDLVEENKQLIDVREKVEFANGSIKGFTNIPMSEIRNNLAKINKDEKVYVSCQSGYRSYNVVMMLRNLGYDAYNITGGYLFVSNYEREMQKLDEDRKDILV